MPIIRRSKERGFTDLGWLESYHTFSFGDYHDPRWNSFKTLRVINDDIIAPSSGFPEHPHSSMEIITYVISGSLRHGDSMENQRVVKAGEFQYMSAGRRVVHSEYNASDTEPLHLLQIWIIPKEQGGSPNYGEWIPGKGKREFVASLDNPDSGFKIGQDCNLFLLRYDQNDTISHPLQDSRGVWAHVVSGEVMLGNEKLVPGDGAGFLNKELIEFKALTNGEILLFDLA